MIEDVPGSVLQRDTTDILDWDDLETLTGEWSFREARDEAYSEALVSVTLDEKSGGQWLTLYPRGGGLELYYGDVELSLHLTFELAAAASTPAPSTISRADLLGSWASDAGSELVLNEDDTFEVVNAPESFITYVDEHGTATSITPYGRWYFVEQTLPLDPETSVVSLSFDGQYGPLKTYVTTIVELQSGDTGLVLAFRDLARWEKR